MKVFLQLTRERDGVTFLANLDHILSVIEAPTGAHICWSTDIDMTQVKETYVEIHQRISVLVAGGKLYE